MAVVPGPNGGLINVSNSDAAKLESANQAELPPVPTDSTVMVASDGKHYNVPPTSYGIAIKNGWRPVTAQETAREEKISSATKAREEHPIIEGLNQFFDEATLGVKPYIEGKNRTAEENDINAASEERYTKQNPIKSYAAKGLGFLAPLAIPGVGEAGELAEGAIRGGSKLAETGIELGEKAAQVGAEASLAKKVAGSAANYATQGALYNSPMAATQAAYGDPEQAAETMLWGVGLGGVLGGVAGLGGAALKGIGKGAVSLTDKLGSHISANDPNGVTNLTNIYRKQVMGMSDAKFNELGAATVDKMVDRHYGLGLGNKSREEQVESLKEMFDKSGKALGDDRKAAAELIKSNPELKEHNIDVNELKNDITEQRLKKFPSIQDEILNQATENPVDKGDKGILDFYNQQMNKLDSLGPDASFPELQQMKQRITSSVAKYESGTPKSEVMRMFDNAIKTHMDAKLQGLFNAAELPERFPQYISNKLDNRMARALTEDVNLSKGTGNIKLPPILQHILGLGAASKIAVGSMLGHPAAGAALALGSAGAKAAFKAFKENKGGLLSKSVGYLREVVNNPNTQDQLGGFMAKAGMEALQEHLGNIPSYLSGSKLVARTLADTNPYQHLIGDTSGLSKDQQYQKLTAAITRASVDTDLTAQKVGHIASTFSGTSLSLASLVASKKLGALAYLQSQIPKNPNPPKAFQDNEWKPTKQQQLDFLSKVSVVNNPMSVWHNYQNDTITTLQRDTLKAVYPKIYSEMVNEIMKPAYDPRTKKLGYDDRMKLSAFTGIPFDNSIKNIAAIQQAVSAPSIPQQQPQSKHRASSRPKLDHSPSLLSSSDSRLYGHNKK